MKQIQRAVWLVLFAFLLHGAATAQHRKLTIILLRHAEKDMTDEDVVDPDLSVQGKQRAQNLIRAINKYRPDAIYSTNYKRTRATVRPLARKQRAMTLIYDERNLPQMRDLILSGVFKKIIVVGHNNTTPALVNMLTGSDDFNSLGENEYDKIFVVKVKVNRNKPNKTGEKTIVY